MNEDQEDKKIILTLLVCASHATDKLFGAVRLKNGSDGEPIDFLEQLAEDIIARSKRRLTNA